MGEEAVKEKEWRAQSSYWLARVALYRAMGGVYVVAFLVSAQQNKALFGTLGLEPARPEDSLNLPRPTPAFAVLGLGDWQLDCVAWLGAFLALLMAFSVVCSAFVPLGCWLLYLSIVNLEAGFVMNYGWEWQVLETGFLVIFLYPPFCIKQIPRDYPPSTIVVFLLRWLAFRVMFGTGMSKLGANASSCWRELTCTTTHYETQPIPNAVAWFMHHLPVPIHKLECAIALFVEVPAPFLVLVPFRNLRLLGGLIPTVLMACIIVTGSYAYINWITLVPFLACLDDAFLARWAFPTAVATEVAVADRAWAATAPTKAGRPLPVVGGFADILPRYSALGPEPWLARSGSLPVADVQRAVLGVACLGLAITVAVKSSGPIGELRSISPWLNYYDDIFMVNAYGVFGFINQKRVGVALEYSHDGRRWSPLDFPAVPGSADRMPAYITPYHYRADWEAWIDTTASMEGDPLLMWTSRGLPAFLVVLIQKVLAGDTQAASLLAEPFQKLFEGGRPPLAVRATPYLYTFSGPAELMRGNWWRREPLLAAVSGEPHAKVLRKMITSPWLGEVSHLPPDRDWAMLFPTLGLAAAAAAALSAGEADECRRRPLYGCSALGAWCALLCLLSLHSGLPTWQACWISAAVVALCAVAFAFFAERLLGDEPFKASPARASLTWAGGSSALYLASFFLTLTGCYLLSFLFVLALGVGQVVLLGLLWKDMSADELLLAAAGITLAALLANVGNMTFQPPGGPVGVDA